MALALASALVRAQDHADSRSSLVFGERPTQVRVVEGPILLHACIDLQWGGHTFSYLVEGEHGLFWSAKRVGGAGAPLVGQHPKPGSTLAPAVHEFVLPADVTRSNQPLVMRTPDGHLHVFVGYEERSGEREPGRVRYFRSERPEDVTAFVDRTECLPLDRYSDFHLRMNAGVSRDGTRLVLAILTTFVPEKHSNNVPLVFFGRRDGLDFRFEQPIVWGEVTPFFYPQVAVTEPGPVLVGAVDADPSRYAELVQLDWDGRVVFREKLPFPEVAAQSWAFELEPVDADDWTRLVLVRSITPAEGTQRVIEFWSYDATRHELARVRAFPNDVATQQGFSNAGQLLALPGRGPLFVNEPGSKTIGVWEGDLLGAGVTRLSPLPGTDPTRLGYADIRSVFLPGLLQGSVPCDGTRFMAIDTAPADLPEGATGPCALLAWRILVEKSPVEKSR
ncbi:MAG: hypothetical protein HOP15_05165 [Planctomycetes bacterium]|nr:hypothetical protein [Planctomycetota bacterium]